MTIIYTYVTIIHAMDEINNQHYQFYYKGVIDDSDDIQDLLTLANANGIVYTYKDSHHRNYNQFEELIERLENDGSIYLLN